MGYKGIDPTDEAPPLSWFIAQRLRDDTVDYDCIILVRGKKGTGKSTGSVGLAAGVAYELQWLTGKPWWEYFQVGTNVKTVDPSGTMDMFSKDTIRKENSILLADDVSISADARSAMSNQNKQLTQIITVSRIYRNLVIMNSVYSTHIDKRLRGFADIIIDMLGIHKPTKMAVAKVFMYDVNQHSGKEYIKYFRWKGKRIKYFYFPMPPPQIIDEYKRMRYEKTNLFLDSIDDKREGRVPKGKSATKRDKVFEEYMDEVVALRKQGLGIKTIKRKVSRVGKKTTLTENWINEIIAESGIE